MPPKAAAPEGGLDPFVTFLLQVLASTEVEIKGPDYYHLFGLSGPKNFGRKVSDYALPYGYKLDHGKMVRLDNATAATKTTKAGSKRNATPATAADDEDEEEAADESPTKKPKSTKSAKPAAKTKSKGKVVKAKPKAEEAEAENEDEASE